MAKFKLGVIGPIWTLFIFVVSGNQLIAFAWLVSLITGLVVTTKGILKCNFWMAILGAIVLVGLWLSAMWWGAMITNMS
jgi:hypothetical protein